MNSRRIATALEPTTFDGSYTSCLQSYLDRGGEELLGSAYELGRTAMADGISLVEVASIHHRALTKALNSRRTAVSLSHELDRASEFFSEFVSPYEMARRGFREAILGLRQLNETLEQEIQRIAHGVHDEAGQLLVAARLVMSGAIADGSPAVRGCLNEVGVILDQAEQELRRISHELRPTILDDLGLVPALNFLVDGVSKRSKLAISIESSIRGRCAGNIETALYRIVQEALTNVCKHACASKVSIRLAKHQRKIRCAIRDDGNGFDAAALNRASAQKGLGLVGIRERINAFGGTLLVKSDPGNGTELLVEIPTED